tara:strand:- start:2722 stop:3816 length:1095 start_codon:yes stop_codon:yes gene_type:complete
MKRNICQIIGYFDQPNINPKMKRVILRNFSNERYNFFLFVQSNMSPTCPEGYLGNCGNTHFFRHSQQLYDLLVRSQIHYIVLSIDFFGLYNCIERFDQDRIYYIGHGITPFYYQENTVKYFGPWKETKMNILTCCNAQYEIVSKHKENIYKIGSIPQFDNLLLTGDNLTNKKPCIYIIGPRRNDTNSYKNMSTLLASVRNQWRGIIAYKRTGIADLDHSFYTNHGIYVQDPRDLIYSYYSSEIIVIFDGGTSYLEALMVNAKVILYIEGLGTDFKRPSYMSEVHYIEILHYVIFPYKDYPSLLVAGSPEEFNDKLSIIKNNPGYFSSEQYVKDKNQFIKDSIGEYVPDVGRQLIDIIEQKDGSS